MLLDTSRGIRSGVDGRLCTRLILFVRAPRSRARSKSISATDSRASSSLVPAGNSKTSELSKGFANRVGESPGSAVCEAELDRGTFVDTTGISGWVAASARRGLGHSAMVIAARPNATATHKDTHMSLACVTSRGAGGMWDVRPVVIVFQVFQLGPYGPLVLRPPPSTRRKLGYSKIRTLLSARGSCRMRETRGEALSRALPALEALRPRG